MDTKSNKQTILIVDDTTINLEVMDEILNKLYNVILVKKGELALEIASKTKPDLILLDIMMPNIDGYEVCKRLKQNPITKKIPVIFVSAMNQVIDEAKGFEIGAVDYITKPVSSAIVLARVKTHLSLFNQNRILEEKVNKKTLELKKTRLQIIKKLGRAAEYKDNETGLHIVRMSNYCKEIALEYGFDEDDADLLLSASAMHDIGKIGIPDTILKKKGKLNKEEWTLMKTHSFIGAQILDERDNELIDIAYIIANEHHEKWNGTGYPNGLKENEIIIYARIAAVADVFDALTSKRPYKEAWSIEVAVNYIKEESGKHFDPEVVIAFEKSLNKILKIKEKYKE